MSKRVLKFLFYIIILLFLPIFYGINGVTDVFCFWHFAFVNKFLNTPNFPLQDSLYSPTAIPGTARCATKASGWISGGGPAILLSLIRVTRRTWHCVQSARWVLATAPRSWTSPQHYPRRRKPLHQRLSRANRPRIVFYRSCSPPKENVIAFALWYQPQKEQKTLIRWSKRCQRPVDCLSEDSQG